MPNCFVIMGFGEKTDLATGRKLNLDKTYKNIIKPAVEAAGYTCVRADEVQHAGAIDIPMYEMLYTADLVVADLSTANLNAVFELGVRYGLRPRTTIIIAEDQFNNPFDVNHIVVRKYQHLGPDIGYDEVQRVTKELTTLAKQLANGDAIDSPVYTFLTGLQRPERKILKPNNELKEKFGKMVKAPMDNNDTELVTARDKPEDGVLPPENSYFGQFIDHDITLESDLNIYLQQLFDRESYGALLEIVHESKNNGNWVNAKAILLRVYEVQTKPKPDGTKNLARTNIVQELALATYKAGDKAGGAQQVQAYAEAIELLTKLDPLATTDPETLGLWSAVHKRRAELPGRKREEKLADLNTAILAAERGFFIRQDYYTGGNLAFMLDVRAELTSGDEQTADRVLARRYRKRIVDITEAQLARIPAQSAEQSAILNEEYYWVKAANAEALVGLGDPKGQESLDDALKHAPHDWMTDTTIKQIDKLNQLYKGR